MNALTDAREELATALAGDSEDGPVNKVTAYVPDVLEAPCIAIQPADPYVQDSDSNGNTFAVGEWGLLLEVYCLVELVSNEQAFDDLDGLVVDVLGRLPSDWFVEGVTQPQPFHTADWLAHGVKLTVSTRIQI